jgi:hypothetical protein
LPDGDLESTTRQLVTENEFIDLIASESGESPTTPDPSFAYPLKAPLLVSTQTSSVILPVDWGDPIAVTDETFDISREPLYSAFGGRSGGLCETTGCRILSPDRLNLAMIQDDGTIMFTQGDVVDGQTVEFSSTSDAAIVWNDCQLTAYTTGYPPLGQGWYETVPVNSIELTAEDCRIYHNVAAWSPDGRLLAFSDDAGLWLWDVLTPDAEPRLLLPAEGASVPLPNYFSPMGRYLNFADGAANAHLDLVSGAVLPDGLISPDERTIVQYDTTAESSPYQICPISGSPCLNGPLSGWFLDADGNMDRFYDLYEISAAYWRDQWSLLVRACTNDDYDRCALHIWRTDDIYGTGWDPNGLGEGYDFDYSRATDTLAYVRDATTISVARTTLDTSAWFDEPVVSVEWLPPLFYYDD